MKDLPSHVFCREGNRIFGDHRLTRRSVGRHKHAVSHFQTIDSFFLEVVEFEGVLSYQSGPAELEAKRGRLTWRAISGTSS